MRDAFKVKRPLGREAEDVLEEKDFVFGQKKEIQSIRGQTSRSCAHTA
jgi:hypothetical protein